MARHARSPDVDHPEATGGFPAIIEVLLVGMDLQMLLLPR